MTLKKINKWVISFSSIPQELKKHHWLNNYNKAHTYVECHIDPEEDDQKDLTKWVIETYPFLITEESFFIHMDNA